MIEFDIDLNQFRALTEELGATPKQVKAAMARGLRRTEATLRKLSSKGLTKELQLKTATALRSRLKTIKLRGSGEKGEITLWYGLNPLPASSFKGAVKQDDDGAWKKDFFFKDAFVGKSKKKGQNTIFKRAGKARLPIVEQTITIEDQAFVYIEDEIFVQVLDIFWQHFERDLRARVKYNLGAA